MVGTRRSHTSSSLFTFRTNGGVSKGLRNCSISRNAQKYNKRDFREQVKDSTCTMANEILQATMTVENCIHFGDECMVVGRNYNLARNILRQDRNYAETVRKFEYIFVCCVNENKTANIGRSQLVKCGVFLTAVMSNEKKASGCLLGPLVPEHFWSSQKIS